LFSIGYDAVCIKRLQDYTNLSFFLSKITQILTPNKILITTSIKNSENIFRKIGIGTLNINFTPKYAPTIAPIPSNSADATFKNPNWNVAELHSLLRTANERVELNIVKNITIVDVPTATFRSPLRK